MCNFFYHISRYRHVWVCLAFLFISFIAFAQDEVTVDTAYTVTDSMYTEDDEPKEDEPHFDRLLQNDSMQYRPLHIPDSALDRLKKDEAFWYANFAPKEEKKEDIQPDEYSTPFYQKKWFRTLVWVLVIGGFIAVLVWFLIASDVKLFRKKSSIIYEAQEGDLPEDIFSINYDTELNKAIASGNYRLGVRLMFLHSLKLLAERELIRYKAERTNSDYLMELWNTSYYNDFFKLTRHFEYVWYGKFEISKEAFAFVQSEYNQLKTKIG